MYNGQITKLVTDLFYVVLLNEEMKVSFPLTLLFPNLFCSFYRDKNLKSN